MNAQQVPALPDPTFEAHLRALLRSDVEFIELIGDDLMQAGGKRVRPAVSLLAAQLLGIQPDTPQWAAALNLAACTELLHSASLLHDDLIDNADTRRGHATAFKRFGNVVSVMSGDFMLSRLLVTLAELPHSAALTRAFGHTASVVCEGEVLQFQVAAYSDYSRANYLKVIYGKTAALLELAAFAPALMLGQSQDDPAASALATFGREYGMAFQMRDDLLDLTGTPEQLGKPVGGDLREGKATWPLLLLLETPDGPAVREILERRGSVEGDLARVLALVEQHAAAAQTEAEIRQRLERALAALEPLPSGQAREALGDLARRELSRLS